jgi:para-aminobenzoate synthetase
MRTLLIDNYDSFTYNVFQMVGKINGEAPHVVRNDEVTWDSLRGLDFDNIIVSPGPGRPERAKDFGISAAAILEADVPVLGVCLGLQGIAHLFGGKVVYAPTPMHGRVSDVYHEGGSLFANIPSPFKVVRYHSLAVSDLPPSLRVTATTADGLVMALEHESRPIYGVQFHPESICTEWGARLFENFARLTRAASKRAVARPAAPPPAERPRPAPKAPRYKTFWAKLDLWPNALACFRELFAAKPTAYWLDSSMAVEGLSRFSFMGDGEGPLSHTLQYDVAARALKITTRHETRSGPPGFFEYLKERLAEGAAEAGALPFDFNGGYVGYVGYEMKKECGAAGPHASDAPDAQLLFADRLIAFDHQQRCVYLVCVDEADSEARATAWLEAMKAKLAGLAKTPAVPRMRRASSGPPPAFRLRHPRKAYLEKIESCQQAIRQGETYEVCLTNRVVSSARPDPLALYEELRRRNPAPYAAYLKYEGMHVLSSSPERFLKIDRERVAESKPIKGTQRRGRTAAEDQQLREGLAQSEKNRSENLMIVDLVRNDLGRSCEIGSVSVPKLMAIEEYTTVHQMVSTIVGKLREDVGAVDAFRAAFPGGSMTGAPKLRTMEIIDELEEGPRGVYSGAIGYFALSGACDFNIVIRTIQLSEAGLSIGVGGAIVALSDAEGEFDEILLKAEAPLRAAQAVLVDGSISLST